MRISDWSSDVCSSDLTIGALGAGCERRENIDEGDADELDDARQLACDREEARSRRARRAGKQQVPDQCRCIAEQPCDAVRRQDRQTGQEGIERGIAAPWTAPEVGAAVMARDQP